MTLSEDLLVHWYWYTQTACGCQLPINHMELSEDGEAVYIGYAVADGERPVRMLDGIAARKVMVYCTIEEVDKQWKH